MTEPQNPDTGRDEGQQAVSGPAAQRSPISFGKAPDGGMEAVSPVTTATPQAVANLADKLDSADRKEAAVNLAGMLSPGDKPDFVAQLVGNLPSADQMKQAAVAAVGALSSEATPSAVATMVGNLDSADQTKAAVAAVGALSSAATPSAVATMVGNLDSADKTKAAAAALSTLPQDQQQQLASSVLGTPSPRVQGALWLIVVGTISAAIFVFGVLSFVLVFLGKGAEGPLALATTALGGIVGLLATTPGRKS